MLRSVDGSANEHPGCLDEQEVVDFTAGLLTAEKIPLLEEHLSGCERCTELIAAAAPHIGAASSTQVTRSIETQPFGPQPSPLGGSHGRERPLLAPGTPLDATYQVVRFLGRGGMGDVYEVKHARLAGRYAAKLLSSDLVNNLQAFSRFQREAMIASGLNHPNIVNVIDFCHLGDGLPCLVMEFLNGNDLGQVMANGPLPLQRTLRLVRQIVSALGTLHGLQIIHRDLKPQNIFVLPESDGEPERVKLVDFGLAKRANPSMVVTHDRALLGTPQYMAPEQAVGNADSVGPESDQFSLAAIVYEMLGGRHPFGGEVLSTVLYRIVHEPPVPLANVAPHVPPHVIAAIERGLSKDRQARFASVKAFLQALEGEGPAMTPAPPAPNEESQRRSWFLRRELLASAGVLLAGVGIAAYLRSHDQRSEMPAARESKTEVSTTPKALTPGGNPRPPGLTIERGTSQRADLVPVPDRTDSGARRATIGQETPPKRAEPERVRKGPKTEAARNVGAKPGGAKVAKTAARTGATDGEPAVRPPGGDGNGAVPTGVSSQPPPANAGPPPILIRKL